MGHDSSTQDPNGYNEAMSTLIRTLAFYDVHV